MTDALRAEVVIRRHDGFSLDVAFTAPSGETVALLGPNGAGKSTLLGAVAGLVTVDRGFVSVGDRVLTDTTNGVLVPPERREMGMVFQESLLFPHLDVLDNVAFGLRSTGRSTGEANGLARRWLERLGVGGLASRRVDGLSGGEIQKVALARALATSPVVLLLDEPVSALDMSARLETRRFLGDHLGRFRGPRIVVTHDPTEAFVLADRVLIIEEGRVLQEGPTDELFTRPATQYVADLLGDNRLRGRRTDPTTVWVGQAELTVVEGQTGEDVLVTIRPEVISFFPAQPEGSPRNRWQTIVTGLERRHGVVRVHVGDPLPLVGEITPSGASALGITPGADIWVAIKATEIDVIPV